MLYDRIIKQGTLNEKKGKPTPQFALPSTVNWMRAIRMLVDDMGIDFSSAANFYGRHGNRHMGDFEANSVFEQLFLSLHHLSALEGMKSLTPRSDFARIGILGWYYGISNAASAMIAAQNGSFQEDHAGTARIWDETIAGRGHAMEPFSWRVSSLVEKSYKEEVASLKGNGASDLINEPKSVDDARGAAAAYLSGSAKWYAWKVSDDLQKTQEFKALGVQNFRTKKAQELRDRRLSKRAMGFVHQAARYRGKANYREALFLAYGGNVEIALDGFVEDQAVVLRAFLAMAGAFASRKLGKTLWNEFVDDIEKKRAFSTSPLSVWTKS